MKNRAFLVLMEQLIMVLVFSVAAAACLGLFVRAGRTAGETARLGEAVILAQNAAETLKASGGAAGVSTNQEGYRVEINRKAGEIPGFGEAEILVYYGEECLYSLETGWQEGVQ